MSGPGAITTSLVLMSEAETLEAKATLFLAVLCISLISYIVLIHSDSFQKKLGQNGTNVIEKLMGLIVIVMGVQFILNGFRGYLVGIF